MSGESPRRIDFVVLNTVWADTMTARKQWQEWSSGHVCAERSHILQSALITLEGFIKANYLLAYVVWLCGSAKRHKN